MRFGYERRWLRRNCNRRSIHRLAVVVPVRSSAASPAATRTARFGWLAALAAAFSALVYVNALDNPFVYDDFRTVLNNPSIEDIWEVSAIVYREMTRPVVNFSYAWTGRSAAAACWATTLTNVLLHVLNVLLLFQVARRTVEDQQARHGGRARPAADQGHGGRLHLGRHLRPPPDDDRGGGLHQRAIGSAVRGVLPRGAAGRAEVAARRGPGLARAGLRAVDRLAAVQGDRGHLAAGAARVRPPRACRRSRAVAPPVATGARPAAGAHGAGRAGARGGAGPGGEPRRRRDHLALRAGRSRGDVPLFQPAAVAGRPVDLPPGERGQLAAGAPDGPGADLAGGVARARRGNSRDSTAP